MSTRPRRWPTIRPPSACTSGPGPRRARPRRRLRAIGLLQRFIQKKGGFPQDVRTELDRERLVLLAEGIPTILTRGGKRKAALAAVAISQQRLAIFSGGEPLVDVTWDSGDAQALELAPHDKGLAIAFDAERVGGTASGQVELVLRIADPAALVAAIEQRRRPLKPRRRLDADGD